jgi:hypothetical protein
MEQYSLMEEFSMPSTFSIENGVVHGLCKIEMSVPFEQCKANRWARADYKVCNVITEVIPFSKTVKASGNLGTWPLNDSTELVRQEAMDNLHKRKSTGALRTLGLSVYSANESKKRAADNPPDDERLGRKKESLTPTKPDVAPTKCSVVMTITRTKDGMAGYNVASINTTSKSWVAIANVDGTGPARVAGMSEEHVGWQVVRIDDKDIDHLDGDQVMQVLAATRGPHATFKLTMQGTYPPGSENEALLQNRLANTSL